MSYYVYVLASRPYGTLYIGVTNDIVRRVWEHRTGVAAGFTKQNDVKELVYFEAHATAIDAIRREKRLKQYRRDWKINLIERENPHWEDLWPSITR